MKKVFRFIVSDRIVRPYLYFWAWFILRCRKPTVIGVTGSAGKTTTTQAIAAVLMHPDAQSVVGVVHATTSNMNNDEGLPLTVLLYDRWLTRREKLRALLQIPFRCLALVTIRRYPKILVLEYAAGWEGHVPYLARLAPPTIGIVTAIGPAHLERMKTVEGVAVEKSALVSAVPTSGLVILGEDHEYASFLAKKSRAMLSSFQDGGWNSPVA